MNRIYTAMAVFKKKRCLIFLNKHQLHNADGLKVRKCTLVVIIMLFTIGQTLCIKKQSWEKYTFSKFPV